MGARGHLSHSKNSRAHNNHVCINTDYVTQGIKDTYGTYGGLDDDNKDPFLESDAYIELQGLIDSTVTSEEACSMKEYLHGDNDLPVCVDLDSETWDDNLLAQVGQNNATQTSREDISVKKLKK